MKKGIMRFIVVFAMGFIAACGGGSSGAPPATNTNANTDTGTDTNPSAYLRWNENSWNAKNWE